MTTVEREQHAQALIKRLGIAYATILAVYLAASPFLAAVAPFYPSGFEPGVEGAGLLLQHLSPSSVFQAWLRGESSLNSPAVFAAVYAALAGSATLCWAAAIAVLHRYRDSVSAAHVRSVTKWSAAFIVIAIFATPVVVHDFWLSVGWGRIVASGANPYYVPIAIADLPFREPVELMTYGPLWAIATGATAALTGGSLLGTAVLQKILIGGAWLGCIAAVRALLRDRSQGEQALGVAATGWAPIALLHGIADGHTDSLMALPMVLWLLLLERGRPFGASMSLAASIAMKYVSAPLLVLHAFRGTATKDGNARWVRSAIACLAAVAVLIALFYRSPDFFGAATAMKSWRFFTPTAVIDGAMQRLGAAPPWLAPSIDFVLRAIVVGLVVTRLRVPGESGFRSAVLWTMLGILLAAVGHVWPWFLIWVLPLATIQLHRRSAWLVIGMTALSPFILIPWTVLPNLTASLRLGVPGVALYLGAAAGLLLGSEIRKDWLAKRA